jgi:hypothetical protein
MSGFAWQSSGHDARILISRTIPRFPMFGAGSYRFTMLLLGGGEDDIAKGDVAFFATL